MAERLKWLRRPLSRARKQPSVPEGMRVYAVGDIHGRLDLLETILEIIWADAAEAPRNTLVFLGDYIDRGPASKDVVECLVHLRRPGWTIVALRGNHDQILLDFTGTTEVYRLWRELGGAETLRSYGVRPPLFDDNAEYARARDELLSKLPAQHLEFFRALPYYFSAGDYLFVHAGVRPGIALDRQSPEDLIWIREEFLASDRRLEKVVVHGHTPSERPIVRTNRIGLDTGAYATGCLTAAVFEGEKCRFLSALLDGASSPRPATCL
jgi:serine/threonine protein phosphatase 1